MSLEKEFEALIGGNDEAATVEYWLDTGFPPLNHAISGSFDNGMPVGRVVEMFGGESSGKTAIATMVMAAAQRAGGIAVFMDHEHSFDMAHGESLGLSTDPNKFVYKTPDTFEQSITMAIKVAQMVRDKSLIPDEAPMVVVFDSLASMVPQSKLMKDAEDYNMNDNTALARATSAVFPALAKFAEKNNMCFLFLNQIRQKIGVMFGDKTTTPGGDSPKYYSSVRIKLNRNKITEERKGVKGNVFIGQHINAECIKNKVSRPFMKAKWRFMFRDEDGSGFFDVAMSMIEYLNDLSLLEKSGNFIKWTDGKKYYPKALAKKLNEEGSVDELKAFLPS
tara:strand:- start:96682 stop:97686 length:1005 start_codon:yes stop_codon:yes gene_type:complete